MEQGESGKIPHLRINAGGEIDSAEVIGREKDIQYLLRMLDQQSVLVAAERRIGKTTICKQALQRMGTSSLALYKDIESVNNTLELAETMLGMAQPHLAAVKQWCVKGSRLVSQMSGLEITLPEQVSGAGLKLPQIAKGSWKEIISATVADLIKAQTTGRNPKKYVTFFLDEFPIALEKICASEGEAIAMDTFDLFRGLRSEHGKTLRFVFTGSIGIHHIIKRLQKAGYSNRPLNDVHTQRVHPLAERDARTLALGLLYGEEIDSLDYEAAAQCILRETSCLPFYIHHVVNALWREGQDATEANIRAVVQAYICSADDPWDLRNYSERLYRHFSDTRPVAVALLNILATTPVPLSGSDIVNRIRLEEKVKDTEEEVISDTLDLLEQDFYIERDAEHVYRFRRPLLARAWRHLQKLPGTGMA